MASNNKTSKHLRRTAGGVTKRLVGRHGDSRSPDEEGIPRCTEVSTEVDTTFNALSLSGPDSLLTESCTGYTFSSRHDVRNSLTGLPCVTLPPSSQRHDPFPQPREAILIQMQSPTQKTQDNPSAPPREANNTSCSEKSHSTKPESEERRNRQVNQILISSMISLGSEPMSVQSASSEQAPQLVKPLSRGSLEGAEESSVSDGCELTPESTIASPNGPRNSSCDGRIHAFRDSHGIVSYHNRPTIYEMTADLSESILATQFGKDLAEIYDPRAVWDIIERCVQDLSQLVDSDSSGDQFHVAINHAAGSEGAAKAPGYTDNIQGDNILGTSRKRTYEDQQSSEGEHGGPPGDDNGDERRDGGSRQDKGKRPETRQVCRMACPFTKRNVSRFSNRTHHYCWPDLGFSDIPSLKKHVQTYHKRVALPFPCQRCGKGFTSDAERTDHLRITPPCEVLPRPSSISVDADPEDGISADVSEKLAERKSGHKIHTWNDLWLAIFPNDPVPSSDFEPPMTYQEMVLAFEMVQSSLQTETERLLAQSLDLEDAQGADTCSRFFEIMQGIMQTTLSQLLIQFRDDLENGPTAFRRRRSRATKADPETVDRAARTPHQQGSQLPGLPSNPRPLRSLRSHVHLPDRAIPPRPRLEGVSPSMNPPSQIDTTAKESLIGSYRRRDNQIIPPSNLPPQCTFDSIQEVHNSQPTFAKVTRYSQDSAIGMGFPISAQTQPILPYNPDTTHQASANLPLQDQGVSLYTGGFLNQSGQGHQEEWPVMLSKTSNSNETFAELQGLFNRDMLFGQNDMQYQ